MYQIAPSLLSSLGVTKYVDYSKKLSDPDSNSPYQDRSHSSEVAQGTLFLRYCIQNVFNFGVPLWVVRTL